MMQSNDSFQEKLAERKALVRKYKGGLATPEERDRIIELQRELSAMTRAALVDLLATHWDETETTL